MSTMLPEKKKEQEMEFIPFGTQAKIKLSVHIVKTLVAVPGDKGELPDDRQCMRFMMLCRARQADPFQGDAFMIPFWSSRKNAYEWALVIAHQAFLKRAEVHPDYNGKESGIIVNPQACKVCNETGMVDDNLCPKCKGQTYWDEIEGDFMPDGMELLGGWCKVYYKTKSKVEYQRLRLSTYRKNTPQWKDDAPGMICKCAEAASLRSAFPNTIGGLYLRDEMHEGAGFSSPVFEATTVETGPAEPPKTQPELTKQPTEGEKPSTTADNMKSVAQFRKSLRGTGVEERQVLAYMASNNHTKKEYLTLEELALNAPEAFQKMMANSGAFLDEIGQSL